MEDNHSMQRENLIIKDPTVLPPSSRLLFRSKLGNIENLTNFISTLPHELTRHLETGKIQKWLNRHKVGSGNQIKEHWLINPLEKVLIPLLLDIPVKGVILEGSFDLSQWFFVVVFEKFHHLFKAGGFHLEDLDIFGGINFSIVIFVVGIPDYVGETGSGVWPVDWIGNKNDGIVGGDVQSANDIMTEVE